jgi:hypothetical protein
MRNKIMLTLIVIIIVTGLIGCQSQGNSPLKITSLVTPVVGTSAIPEVLVTATPKVTASKDTLTFKKTNLGSLGQSFAQPALYDTTLVWAGRSDGKLQNNDSIFSMDVGGKSKVLAVSKYQDSPYVSEPNISEDWITWLDSGLSSNKPEYSLMAMNRQNGKVQVIQSFPGFVQNSRYIAWTNLRGNHLIWTQFMDTDLCVLKMYDFSSKTIKTIATLHTSLAPAVNQSDDMVVWEEVLPKEWNGKIQVLDLTTGQIKDYPVKGNYAFPKIYGHYILYSDQPDQTKVRDGLELLDITNGNIIEIPAKEPYFWDIGNGVVAWSDYSKGASNVFAKSLKGDKQQVDLGLGELPYVFDKNIVWTAPKVQNVYITQTSF